MRLIEYIKEISDEPVLKKIKFRKAIQKYNGFLNKLRRAAAYTEER